MSDFLEWSEFERVQIRTGTIIRAEVFAEAKKPAYKLWIDFGVELGTKKSSAQLTAHYSVDELIGKQIVAVVNFPPKQIGPIHSECLVLGAIEPSGGVVLLQTERPIANGLRIA
jgi:tRNA-binding protein